MLCPHCKTELKIADRQGIEIDYCPTCRGVWLDRGELDKILERSLSTATAPRGGAFYDEGRPGGWRRDDDDDDDDRHRRYGRPGYGNPGYGNPGYGNPGDGNPGYGGTGYGGQGYGRRKKSWLGDLFDF